MFELFTSTTIIIACIGLIVATSSFISGLQLVKSTSGSIEGTVHRFNGYLVIMLYILLAVTSLREHGIKTWPLIGWLFGALLIMLKLWIVKKKQRRAMRYVSWVGGSLILMWILVVYIKLPI